MKIQQPISRSCVASDYGGKCAYRESIKIEQTSSFVFLRTGEHLASRILTSFRDCPVLSNPLCIQLISSYEYPSRLQKYLHNPIYADAELEARRERDRKSTTRRLLEPLFLSLSVDLTGPNPYFYYVYGEI